MTSVRMLLDATKSFHLKRNYPKTIDFSNEVKEQLRKKWSSELFDKL